MSIFKDISHLLHLNDCVILPDFGAFILKSKSAYIKNNEFCPPSKYVSFNSMLKDNDGLLAKFISEENPHHVIIGGDQMCVYGDKLLNKPGTKKKAIESLKVLSNQKHYQHSGVCIFKSGECLWEYSETVELKMHNLTEKEIINYVDIENPINAAGAYKFESLGCNLFSYVNGSSHTVRGMPLLPLLNALRELNIIDLE